MNPLISRVAENNVSKLLSRADIRINGSRPWDIQVTNPRFFDCVLFGGSLALGESYMKGWWECVGLDQFFFRILHHGIGRGLYWKAPDILRRIKVLAMNCQKKVRAFDIGEYHYDTGNDLFELMLDPYMTYSCGYWKDADDLDKAQEAKLDLTCRKLNLKQGMRLLDIGCGWGSLALYAARHCGVEVVGLTVSEEQARLARERCSGLPVEISLRDYRDVSGTFDAIASIGMFEHVGYKNYRTFMDVACRNLKEDGLFLLHTIGSNSTAHSCDPWFDKYIFPNGMLPSIEQIGKAIEGYFIMEDWHNLGNDYEKTVLSWYRNFENNWSRLKAKYGDQFFRMWRYYLLSLAGGFRARHIQVWQIVLSRREGANGYRSIRCSDCLH